MAPLCRETFTGVVVALPLASRRVWRARRDDHRRRARATTACLEIGGGPWRGTLEQLGCGDPHAALAPLMGLPVDVRAVAEFTLKPAFGDVLPGL